MARGLSGRTQESSLTGKSYQLAEWLNRHLDTLTSQTNEQLAAELGYSRPNIISMWRTGRTRIPLDRISKIAKILKVDPLYLLPMWLEQYADEDLSGELIRGQQRMASEDEFDILLAASRKVHGGRFKKKAGFDAEFRKLLLAYTDAR